MRSLNGIPERTRSRGTPQIRDPRRLRGLVAQSCHVEGLSEKAATPGCGEGRRSAFPRNPPGNSPSRTAGNHQLCRTLQQGLKTSHVCSGSTLREEGKERNGKIKHGCAEAVEDETSLWKAMEKRGADLRSRVCGGAAVAKKGVIAHAPNPQSNFLFLTCADRNVRATQSVPDPVHKCPQLA